MVRINLAEFDVGFFGERTVKIREYLRITAMWREIACLHAPIFLGMTLAFFIGCLFL